MQAAAAQARRQGGERARARPPGSSPNFEPAWPVWILRCVSTTMSGVDAHQHVLLDAARPRQRGQRGCLLRRVEHHQRRPPRGERRGRGRRRPWRCRGRPGRRRRTRPRRASAISPGGRDVGAQAGLAQDPQHAGRAVRLQREHRAPADRGERLRVGRRTRPQRGGVVDVQRRPEPVGQLVGVDAAQREPAVATVAASGSSCRAHRPAWAREAAIRSSSAASWSR